MPFMGIVSTKIVRIQGGRFVAIALTENGATALSLVADDTTHGGLSV